ERERPRPRASTCAQKSSTRIEEPELVATTADFKNGMVLMLDGKLQQIVEFQHVKPGKGPAFVRTKLKDVVSGKTVDKTFNAGVKVEQATVDRRDMTYLYNDGSAYVLMDDKTYDQVELQPEVMGDDAKFLLENSRVNVSFHDGQALFAELPANVDLKIEHTDPGLQGDRSTGGSKPATLETGAEIQVPLFIETGNVVKVDTRTGEYLSRVTQ